MALRASLAALILLALPGLSLAEPPGDPPFHSLRIRADHFAEDVCRVVAEEATAHSLPPAFLARLIWKESRFDPGAHSPKGAQGIAQFMPGTASDRRLADPYDPAAALSASAALLAELRIRFGNLGLAAAAYNAGPKGVDDWMNGGSLPSETRHYVNWITGQSVDDWAAKKELEILPIAAAIPFDQACLGLATREIAASRPSRGVVAVSVPRVGGGRIIAKTRMPWAVSVKGSNRNSGKRLRGQIQLGANSQKAAEAICIRMKRAGWNCSVAAAK